MRSQRGGSDSRGIPEPPRNFSGNRHLPAPALFARPGILQPSLLPARLGLAPFAPTKRGGRSAAWRIGPSVLPPVAGRRALRSAPANKPAPFAQTSSRRFLGPGRAFREAPKRLSVSELLAPVRSDRRRGPVPSRERGCEPRPRAPFPIPRQARLQDAPLVDQDGRRIKPLESLGIRFPVFYNHK